MAKFEPPERAVRLIREAISKFGLDMHGLVVLTEAASGNYIFTPLIAALAGASRVHAMTRDSGHAPAEKVIKDTYLLADYLGITQRLEIHTELTLETIAEADIVTNLGFLRPIDRKFISFMKRTAVIPLMFETWEFRERDVDLKECWRKGICVLGTNEEDSRLRTFGYLGHLIAKKLFEAGIEVFGSKIVVMGTGQFGMNITHTLSAMGAHVFEVVKEGAFSCGERLSGCDAVIVASHCDPRLMIGTGGYMSPAELAESCPDVVIIHLSGMVNRIELKRYGIRCLPEGEPAPGYMSWPLSELGPRPVIDLNTAGLKVGELMSRARQCGFTREDSEKKAMENSICQVFGKDTFER